MEEEGERAPLDDSRVFRAGLGMASVVLPGDEGWLVGGAITAGGSRMRRKISWYTVLWA